MTKKFFIFSNKKNYIVFIFFQICLICESTNKVPAAGVVFNVVESDVDNIVVSGSVVIVVAVGGVVIELL